MSCALTQGYALDCRDNVGGIKTVYIVEQANVSSVTQASGVTTAVTMAGSTKFWTYQLEKETATYTENIQANEANGTIYYEQDLMIPIRKMQASLRNEIRLLAQNRLSVIVADRNGKYWLLGQNNGLELQNSKSTVGKAFGDFNGYELTFKGKEELPACEVSSSIISGIVQ